MTHTIRKDFCLLIWGGGGAGVGWLVDWLVGWMDVWMVVFGWLVGWLVYVINPARPRLERALQHC